MTNRQSKSARLILALVVLPALCGACAARRTALVDPNAKVLRLKVTKSGDIYLDGRATT